MKLGGDGYTGISSLLVKCCLQLFPLLSSHLDVTCYT